MDAKQPITYPVAPEPWEEVRPFRQMWHVNHGFHYISGGCVSKDGPLIDCHPNLHPKNYGINMVLSGCGTYRVNGGPEQPLKPGVVFQRQPGIGEIAVEIAATEPWVECYVSTNRVVFEALQASGLVCSDLVVPMAEPNLVSARYGRLFSALEGATSHNWTRVWLSYQQLLIEIVEQSVARQSFDPVHETLEHARKILESDIAEPCDVRDVAQEVGLGYEYFRKAFREKYNLAPNAYRVRYRLDQACLLLQDQNLGLPV